MQHQKLEHWRGKGFSALNWFKGSRCQELPNIFMQDRAAINHASKHHSEVTGCFDMFACGNIFFHTHHGQKALLLAEKHLTHSSSLLF